MKRKVDPVGCWVLGCAGLFAAVVVVVAVVAVLLLGRPNSTPSASPASTAGRSPFLPVPVCKGVLPPQTRMKELVAFADPRHVDVAEAFPVAHALVMRLAPDAGLFGISSNVVAPDGKYDLSTGMVFMQFEYRCNEAGLPPGQDLRSGYVHVTVHEGRIEAERMENSSGLGMAAVNQPYDVPPCPTAAAVATAVLSGVPAAALPKLSFTQGSGDLRGESVWLFAVDGHPEYRREVDGKTCSRVTENGRLMAVTAVAPIAPPPPARVLPAVATATATSTASDGDSKPPLTYIRRSMAEDEDLARADVAVLLPAAQALAAELRPDAQLVDVTGLRIARGLANLRPNSSLGRTVIYYNFESPSAASTRQPGEDSMCGRILVTATLATWTAECARGPASKLAGEGDLTGALDAPSCTSARAWAALNLTTSDAVSLKYHSLRASRPQHPFVWTFNGVPRGSVDVDGKTCAVLPPAATPRGAKK